MAEKVGEIYYDVTLELDQMIKDQRRAQQHVDKTADSLQRLTPIAAAAKAALSGLAVMKIIDMADEWGQYASRIKQATQSVEEYTYVQDRMLASANATFRSVQETRESFIQLSPVLREMGLSLGQSVDVIDTFSGLLVVNAASAEKAKGAQDALAKSLQKGKIDADAWMSIYSTLDSVVDIIAESSGKSGAEIRKLGAEGKLGIDLFVNALSDGSAKVAKQVEAMPTTVRDAMQSVVNGLQEYIGWSNQTNGITATISGVVKSLGENFNALANVALVAVSAGLARYVVGATAAAAATVAKTAAVVQAAAAEVALARAEAAQTAVALAKVKALSALTANTAQVTAATLAYEAAIKRVIAAEVAQTASSAAMGGALRGLLAFLTGPAGIAIAFGIAAASIFAFGNGASNAIPKVDELTASIEMLTKAQLDNQRGKAADAIGQLTQKAREANSAVVALERDQSALNKLFQEGRGGIDSEGLGNVNRSLIEARANADTATQALQEMIDADYKLAEAQKQRSGVSSQATRVTRSDPEVQKRLAAMRDEEALAKLAGAARSRLQAIQRLGEGATAAERVEAEKLATSIYNLEQAQKNLGEATKAAKFDSAGYLSSLRQAQASEIGVINETEAEKLRVARKNLDEKKINETTYAEAIKLITQTAEDDRVALMAKTQEKIDKQREEDTRDAKTALDKRNQDIKAASDYALNLTKAIDPIAALTAEYQAKLELVTQYEAMMQAAKTDATAQGELARTQITNEFELQRRALAEQSFRSQGEAQAFLIDSLNSLSSTATSSIVGLIQGTMTAQDALRGLASTVLNEAVGALVQMGVQHVKNALLEKTVSASKGAAYAASVGAQVTGMSALAAQNAFAATAAIPIIGPGLAPAAAAAAAAAAGALGAPAVMTAPLAGARQYGGPVSSGSLYRVNETGAPEMFTASNGNQFMMGTKDGQVTAADQVGGGNVQWNIIINNTAAGTQATASVDQSSRTVEIAVAEVATQIANNEGRVWSALRGATNVRSAL